MPRAIKPDQMEGNMPEVAKFENRHQKSIKIPRRESLFGESEQLFRTLAEKSLTSIYVIQDGRFRFMNPYGVALVGYSYAELVEMNAEGLVHPEDIKSVEKNTRAMLKGKISAPYEFRIITKQGQIRWLFQTVTSISYNGRPAILGNAVDISERKAVEEKLKASELWYRTLFETTGVATMVLESDTTICEVNSIFNSYGYTKEELENTSWKRLVSEKDFERVYANHNLRRMDPHAPPRCYGFQLVTREGELRDIYMTADMIPGTTKSIVSLLDITELKKAEEAIQKRGEELEKKTHELQEMNTALRVLLKQREQDRAELEEKVHLNIKKLVQPYIENLKKDRREDSRSQSDIAILEANLANVVSSFSYKLSSRLLNLTPRELQIANLIKEGKTTKEISDFMRISESSINISRYRIRKKLGLNKRKFNLQTCLSEME